MTVNYDVFLNIITVLSWGISLVTLVAMIANYIKIFKDN